MKITLRHKTQPSAVGLAERMHAVAKADHPPALVPARCLPPREGWAAAVLAGLVPDLAGRAFAAYGPGADELAAAAAARGATAAAPADVAVLYDVLDHDPDPPALLARVRADLRLGGTLLLRCHPWCARDACHLGGMFNKAYLHHVFSPDELARFGMAPAPASRETADCPHTYYHWLRRAGFKVVFREDHLMDVPGVFRSRSWVENFGGTPAPFQFVDFIAEAV